MSHPKIAIIGAGLCGSLMANYFSKRGFDVDVFEYRSDLRLSKTTSGRSINMALSHRGIQALKQVDLFSGLQDKLIAMKGRMIHQKNIAPKLQPYGVYDDHVIYSISRKTLNETLICSADQDPKIDLFFDHKCVDINFEKRTLAFKCLEKNALAYKKYDYCFGTDGAFSKVREKMLKTGRYDYSQTYISHGYKELKMPAGPNETFLIEKNALHIWPQKSFMLIALPNPDGSFTMTLFLDYTGDVSFETIQNKAQATSFFQSYFPGVYDLIPDIEAQFFKNPTGDMVTVSVDPWHAQDRVLLLGDASHAIVPFYGQGMNASFEDVRLFFEMLDQNQSLRETISTFGKSRKNDTDAISQMALDNFVEMRSGVVDPNYVKRRQLEQDLEKSNATDYQSKYTMVSFTDTPYATAQQRALDNKKTIDEILNANHS